MNSSFAVAAAFVSLAALAGTLIQAVIAQRLSRTSDRYDRWSLTAWSALCAASLGGLVISVAAAL